MITMTLTMTQEKDNKKIPNYRDFFYFLRILFFLDFGLIISSEFLAEILNRSFKIISIIILSSMRIRWI